MANENRSETERLILRPFAESDFDALLAIQSRADVARWLYWEARDADAVRAALAKKSGRPRSRPTATASAWRPSSRAPAS